MFCCTEMYNCAFFPLAIIKIHRNSSRVVVQKCTNVFFFNYQSLGIDICIMVIFLVMLKIIFFQTQQWLLVFTVYSR